MVAVERKANRKGTRVRFDDVVMSPDFGPSGGEEEVEDTAMSPHDFACSIGGGKEEKEKTKSPRDSVCGILTE